MREGWRWYRAAAPHGDGCEHLRPVEDHLAHVIQVFSQLVDYDTPAALEHFDDKWRLIEQWLRMAAGLEYVALGLASFDSPYMCGLAMDYQDAADRVASLYATEYTRLMYTWNATELFLKSLQLPQVPEAPGWINSATFAIAEYWTGRQLPDHYAGALKHLVDHIEKDPILRGDKRLARALTETPWRNRGGLLLAASHQLRHFPAHGEVHIPEPRRWGEDLPEAEVSPPALHVPRLGIRGLLFGLQMTVSAVLPRGLTIGNEIQEMWPVRNSNGEWIEVKDPLVETVLGQAQLRPDDSDG